MIDPAEALRAIDELAFQMSDIMAPKDTHPNIGAIRDWCARGLAALAQAPAATQNEWLLFQQLSQALTKGNASTWEQVIDAAEKAGQAPAAPRPRVSGQESESGVITAAPRLTNEEDTKALWLTRRMMPKEPER